MFTTIVYSDDYRAELRPHNGGPGLAGGRVLGKFPDALRGSRCSHGYGVERVTVRERMSPHISVSLWDTKSFISL